MSEIGYYPRYVDKDIDEALATYGAVAVNGPKYCGKTKTSKMHCSSIYALDDNTNNYSNYRLAILDPSVCLEGAEPRLIDEWQLVPQIWDGVRRSVDDDNRPGRFILCGSSTPEDDEKKRDASKRPPLHSGFGRIATVNMRTMSLWESHDSDGRIALSNLFDGTMKNTMTDARNLGRIIDLMMQGGWPGNLGLSSERRVAAVSRYPEDICENDLPRVDPSKSPSRMKRILKSLARNESTLASMRTLARDMKENDDDIIKDSTVSDYVDTLRRMHLIEDVPAFSPGLRSSVRVGKNPKRHLTDPALAVAAMGCTKKMLEDDTSTLGFLFEALCHRDLQIYAKANGGRLYHYRDSSNREVDAIIELPDGRWGAFEVKLGASQTDDAAENLVRFNEMISDYGSSNPSVLCVISGMENAAYRREDGVFVVPITSLRA